MPHSTCTFLYFRSCESEKTNICTRSGHEEIEKETPSLDKGEMESKPDNSLHSYTHWLGEKDRFEFPSVLNWMRTIDESNFHQFPLVKVDDEGWVTANGSFVQGMRVAETFEEWLSQLYFIILSAIANASQNSLSASTAEHLTGRSKKAADHLRSGSVTLGFILKNVFCSRAGVEGSFFGTSFFWHALEFQKCRVVEFSQLRVQSSSPARLKTTIGTFRSTGENS
jgi:hypothetical protein